MEERKVPIQSLIDHIKTAIDVDDWAKEMVEDLLKEREAKEQCLKTKCIICPHCDNCDVDENGLLKEQESVVEALKSDLSETLAVLKEQPEIVRCRECKHGSLYCTEDVCGETLIECNRPDLGDVIEIHEWKWFCADGERKEGM